MSLQAGRAGAAVSSVQAVPPEQAIGDGQMASAQSQSKRALSVGPRAPLRP